MLKNLLLVAQILVLHLCVAQRLIYDENIPVEKLRVVLEQAKGGKVSDMLTDLEYIPLKRGKGGVIDYVLDIQILGDGIGVVSDEGGYFYLYNKDGSLVKKIEKIDGFKSLHPNTKELFFQISKDDNHFLLHHGAFQARVDIQGNIVDTVTRNFDEANEDGQFVQDEVRLGKNSVYRNFGFHINEKRKKYDLISLNDSALIQFDPMDTIKFIYSATKLSKVYGDRILLSGGYNTKIFELDTLGIRKIYELVLPLRNTFDYNPITKFKQDDWMKVYAFFEAHRDKVYSIDNSFFYKEYLIFRAVRWEKPMWIAYHLDTKEVYGLDNIIADASNDYLAFFDSDKIFAEGDYLYSMIYPSHITQAKNKSQEEGHKMRKAYEDLAKHNNPILVRFKLK